MSKDMFYWLLLTSQFISSAFTALPCLPHPRHQVQQTLLAAPTNFLASGPATFHANILNCCPEHQIESPSR